MLNRLLRTLIALFTFIAGVTAKHAYRTFVNRKASSLHRMHSAEPLLTDSTSSVPLTDSEPLPKIIEREYTPGVVAIYFKTNVDGQVTSAYPVSGDLAFRQQGVEAASQMRFPRREYRGHLISTAGLVIYKFSGARRIVLKLDKGPAVTTD